MGEILVYGSRQEGGGLVRLPSAYQEVEYLESSGTQYIDTGVNTSTDTELEAYISLSVINNQMLWANNNGVTNRISCYLSNTGACNFGNKTLSNNNLLTYFILNTKTNVKENAEGIFIGGTKRVNFNNEGIISDGDKMYIFTAKGTGASGLSGNMYNCTIKQNNTLVRNFVPCYRKADSVAGMYDLVNNTFYTNQGTGTFIVGPDVSGSGILTTIYDEYETSKEVIVESGGLQPLDRTITFMNEGNVYQVDSVKSGFGVYAPTINPTKTDYTFKGWGETEQATSYITFPYIPLSSEKILYSIFAQSGRLPSEYQEVEYLESTGTQYIDTGVINNSNDDITVVWASTNKTAYRVFGERNVASSNRFYGLDYNFSGYAKYGNQEYDPSALYQTNTKYTWRMDANKFYENGVLKWTATQQTFTNDYNYYLFKYNGLSETTNGMKLYSCSITRNNTLIRNFIPCYRKADSVAGLYDLVNDVFYINSGTGTFIVGPDVN